jgi:hypothetical protein
VKERKENSDITNLAQIVLLTQEQKFGERVGVTSLADYVAKLEHTIFEHFNSMEKNDGFNLMVEFFVKICGSVDVTLRKFPPSYDDTKISLHRLKHDLTLVKPPQVYTGPVGFRLELTVWGGYNSIIKNSSRIEFSHNFTLAGDSPELIKEEYYEMLDYVNNKGFFINNFSKWTSGNDEIDKFLRDSQCNLKTLRTIMELIPYENLINIKYLAEGGFATVYSASWRPGYIQEYDMREHRFKRAYEGPTTNNVNYGYYDSETNKFIEDDSPKFEGCPVILKSFNKSKDSLTDLLYEVK